MENSFAGNSDKEGRVLIVDDNPMNLQILGQILGQTYHVEFATNGKMALDWLESNIFDIILLDINMPEMDGFEVCKIIRKNIMLDEMPVIFISALDDRDSIYKGFELGAQDYVSKPFDSRELFMRVKTHIALKKSKEELKLLNEDLEEKVRTRTKELQIANDELISKNNELSVAKDAAEAGDRLKSAFISNISHEIRTPLNGILGFASFISEPDLDEEERFLYSDAIKRSSDRLLKTVTDYMDISLLESKTIKNTPVSIKLSQLLHGLYRDYLPLASSGNISFYIHTPDHSHSIQIQADEELIIKAISHVLDNAFKYTQEGEINIYLELENNKAIIKISDTGLGIDADSQTTILDTFSKGQYDIDNTIDGNGLGLSISSKIMELYNGEIKVQSKIGEGTQVSLILDSIIQNHSEISQNIYRKPKIHHVLVAEDDDMNYLYLEILLKKMSAKITRAENGFEAVNNFNKYKDINFILMDISMPEMDGFEAMEKIREKDKEVTIFAVSAYNTPGSTRKALDIGANEYISKPVSKAKLLSIIGEYFKI